MRSKPKQKKRSRKRKRLRVLIVEDSAQIRESLFSTFSCLPHLEVVGFAEDGVAAVESIRAHKPDVITLDIRLPRMSGLGVLRTIREEKLEGEVVVLTAITDEFYRTKCRELSVPHFFDKITQFEQFVELMKTLRTA